jgi:hypothetical protein
MSQSKSLPWYIGLAADLLSVFVPLMTAAIRDKLTRWVKENYQEALSTPNPFDDMVFLFLGRVLAIDM